jgi:phage terminase Nu1 subunit (DNA packaging protein)
MIYDWFNGYLILGDGTMKEQEKQAAKDAKQAEKRIAMETARLAREQAIQKGQAVKEAKREAKRIEEEPARLARSLAKRKTNLT